MIAKHRGGVTRDIFSLLSRLYFCQSDNRWTGLISIRWNVHMFTRTHPREHRCSPDSAGSTISRRRLHFPSRPKTCTRRPSPRNYWPRIIFVCLQWHAASLQFVTTCQIFLFTTEREEGRKSGTRFGRPQAPWLYHDMRRYVLHWKKFDNNHQAGIILTGCFNGVQMVAKKTRVCVYKWI